jgi:hypothetical protein
MCRSMLCHAGANFFKRFQGAWNALCNTYSGIIYMILVPRRPLCKCRLRVICVLSASKDKGEKMRVFCGPTECEREEEGDAESEEEEVENGASPAIPVEIIQQGSRKRT